ncbi:ribosome small subunit-dependent GTPase A [Pseudoduganella buxea]|uniref:Ribosome small subunit-dependent GTPase A n=1 Tax=Pseudoduganella buxea TaxID=1949069 RepID=A0A6I3SQW6_9BURK|nr:ribosome small subunit-dependent GTPase A [Pseudoduganella buxea]MTV51329.1 ribosome small subunit-dependent GTPase A [Pseudoduganella buxea]GGC09406.1 hypothetical protein GCM10011572_33620 [Pseudoduganella buxea]
MIDFDIEALRTIGFNHSIHQHLATQLAGLDLRSDDRLMRVIAVQREQLTIHDGHAQYLARALPKLHDGDLTVGDWVLAQLREHGEWWLTQRLAPLSLISRRANDGRRQILASNIDTALLVMGLDDDFNPRRLERYIALVQAAGITPVVVLTKADIGHAVDERISLLQHRLPSAILIHALNALSPDVIDLLAPTLQPGQTACLLGASGTGKSTLTNTLTRAHQDTGGVRKSDGRGMHTTTGRSLHFSRTGACIIDTPGLRTWQPDADETTLAATFDDIDALAAQCQFRDCRHQGEPGCAVIAHVDPDRVANFHKLLRDVRRGEQTPLQRIAERGKWKTMQKAASSRIKEKYR